MTEGFVDQYFCIVGKADKCNILYSGEFTERKINAPEERPQKADDKSGERRQHKQRPPFFNCFSYHRILPLSFHDLYGSACCGGKPSLLLKKGLLQSYAAAPYDLFCKSLLFRQSFLHCPVVNECGNYIVPSSCSCSISGKSCSEGIFPLFRRHCGEAP